MIRTGKEDVFWHKIKNACKIGIINCFYAYDNYIIILYYHVMYVRQFNIQVWF